ncbi:MAG: hypothetical protein AAB657_04570 [Patescibacteria group bacterium]
MKSVNTTTRDKVGDGTLGSIQVIFPVVLNPKPKALVVHCADVRFRKAFRNFIEGDSATGCLGFKEDEYVNLVIPGGVSSFTDVITLPKQFKVAKDQIGFLLNHFPTIDTVILINHEDCAAYKFLQEKIGSMFLRRFVSLLDRQKVDLVSAAKTVLEMDFVKANVRLFMAKFANPEHTQVAFNEITVTK